MSKNTAYWSVTLDFFCPDCDGHTDLMEDPDFFAGGLEVAEHGTDASKDYEIACQHCHRDFKVDFEY